jgi:hypothetical protein
MTKLPCPICKIESKLYEETIREGGHGMGTYTKVTIQCPSCLIKLDVNNSYSNTTREALVIKLQKDWTELSNKVL